MDQFRQIGKVLGSLKALMVFKEDIQINQRQCCLLFDIFELAFEGIAEEIKEHLKFEERNTKWKTLEQPLKELYSIFKEGEFYVKQCLETKDFWAKAVSLAKNTDCVEFHIHNLLCCFPVVVEAIESVGEISGCDDDDIQKKKIMFSKKYEKEWRDPKLFQWKFGKQYLVSQDICKRLEMAWKEDRWVLVQMIKEKRGTMTTVSKQQQQLAEMLCSSLSESSNVKLFPSSILFGSKDYQVRRRLGSGSQYKEIQWLGESFVLRYILGDIEPLIPEICRLSSLAHPNIVHALCAFSDEEKKECCMVMELMSKDLYSHIKETCGPRKRIPFSLPVAVDVMLQIARGMEYLHSQKIYHGDLNPSNVLIRERSCSSEGYLHAKVSGFSLFPVKNSSTGRSVSTQNGTITFIWYAPEVLLEQEQPGNICNAKYTEKADIYSFGMICFEVLTGKVPFEDSHLQGDKMSRNIRAGERPLFPFHSPKYLTSLTKKCWQTDPVQRPTFSSICRILRYIKRFLLMNPDHSQPDPPLPQIDYYEVEVGLLKKLVTTVGNSISQIPFQMFSYKVLEKEKAIANLREKGSESSSDGASSACGDENLGIVEDPFLPAAAAAFLLEKKNPIQQLESVPNRRNSLLAKKNIDAKTNRQPVTPKGRTLRPPQLTSCGRSIRMNSESQLPMVSPSSSSSRRRSSGHASDSELG